ncbi:hypothetical protein [Natronococcus occultus]|uniref:DUF8054 domain-containing protein n=1 Tax=Natronococcus occultus SP4 TaxID=694430 RepID=L0JWK6_9EURY|nr:hypothetical protein [Natronococcus occultus]AGB36484.1 hypothetical protein Natoc_0624 [Natronococcus occultus SP4]
MTGDTPLERATRWEHADESRCIPCTVLSLAIAAVAAVVVGVAVPSAGIVLFVVAVTCDECSDRVLEFGV